MSHNTSVAMSNNNVFVPYDIILEVFQHVDDDDLRTLHSLLLTSKSLYRLAAPKAWATLYLTSHGSVASAFEAIMKNPELRPWVKSIRFPDPDSKRNPPPAYDPDIAIISSDPHDLQVLAACLLTNPDQEDILELEEWSFTEAMTAAMMVLLPNLETAILDKRPRRDLETLEHIFVYDDLLSPIRTPEIRNWRVVPDALEYDNVEWCHELMDSLGAKRLDLIPYPGNQFNTPFIDAFLPYLENLEDLRVEDNVFSFDDRALHLPTMVFTANTTQLQLPGDQGLYADFQHFLATTAPFKFGHMGKHVRRLHWKVVAPFLNERRPGAVGPHEFDMDHVDSLVEAVKEDMQEEDEEEELEMNMQGQEGPLAGWSIGDSNDDSQIQAQPADVAECAAGQRPIIITPSLFFARSWRVLDHLETTTGAVYGLPASLFQQRYVTRVLPRYLEVLVLEERWHAGCGPQGNLLHLYRRRLYDDLTFMARGIGLPNLQRLVFIPDQRAGYWTGIHKKAGLPDKMEWVRGGANSGEPFPEMKDIVEAEREKEEVQWQCGEWKVIWGGLNARF